MRKAATMRVQRLAFAAGAHAAEVGGVKLDDKANVGGQELVLNGAGVRTRAMFKVYVGSLYCRPRRTRRPRVLAKGPRRVQLNLLRDLSPDQLVDALVEGLKENNQRPSSRRSSRRSTRSPRS